MIVKPNLKTPPSLIHWFAYIFTKADYRVVSKAHKSKDDLNSLDIRKSVYEPPPLKALEIEKHTTEKTILSLSEYNSHTAPSQLKRSTAAPQLIIKRPLNYPEKPQLTP
jgi:hypothetical protein